jgi:hypothetical protein
VAEVRQAVELVRLAQDEKEAAGPHSLIRNPVVCLFWRKVFNFTPEVPWFAFWDSFPDRLSQVRLLEPFCNAV